MAHLHTLRRVHDRHGRWYHIAVQVEVRRVGVQAIRRDIDRRWKIAEQEALPNERVGTELVLPVLAVREAVARRHEEELAVARDRETVRAFHLRRQLADRNRLLDHKSVGTESKTLDEVRRLGTDVQPVVVRGLFRCRHGSRRWGTGTRLLLCMHWRRERNQSCGDGDASSSLARLTGGEHHRGTLPPGTCG